MRTKWLLLVLLLAGGALPAEAAAPRALDHYLRGAGLVERKQYVAAIAEFQAAVQLDPNYANAYYNLGSLHYRLGRYAEAARAFESTLRIDPDHDGALLWLPISRQRAGQAPGPLPTAQSTNSPAAPLSGEVQVAPTAAPRAVSRRKGRLHVHSRYCGRCQGRWRRHRH